VLCVLNHRCGMVYCDAEELKWMPYVQTWLAEVCADKMRDDTREFLFGLFEKFVEDGLQFVNKKCTQAMAQVS
jgi:dynein heavy chain, axonemal